MSELSYRYVDQYQTLLNAPTWYIDTADYNYYEANVQSVEAAGADEPLDPLEDDDHEEEGSFVGRGAPVEDIYLAYVAQPERIGRWKTGGSSGGSVIGDHYERWLTGLPVTATAERVARRGTIDSVPY